MSDNDTTIGRKRTIEGNSLAYFLVHTLNIHFQIKINDLILSVYFLKF